MSWHPGDFTPLHQIQPRIIPPHVTVTALLSPKATSGHLKYPARCDVPGLIWGLAVFSLLSKPAAQYFVERVRWQCRKLPRVSLCVIAACLLWMLCCRGGVINTSWSCCELLIWGKNLGIILLSQHFPSPQPLSFSLSLFLSPRLLLWLMEWYWRWGSREHRAGANWAFFVPGHCCVPRQNGPGVNPSSTQEPHWIDNVGT